MTIPDYQRLMAPVLRHLSDGAEHSARELADALATELGLTDSDVAKLLPSGKMTV
jgi:restriction system protein